MYKSQKIKIDEKGFTVIELMIATLIFSVILVAITAGVMNFTKAYYRSTFDSMTQNSVRNITEAVTKAVQFGKAPIVIPAAPGSNYFCAGGYMFVYTTNKSEMYTSGSTTTGFYMKPNLDAGCTYTPIAAGEKVTQFLTDRMSVQYVKFEQTSQGANITVKIAYGDPTWLTTLGQNAQCTPGNGSQFCSVSAMTASATQRTLPIL